MKPKCNMKSQRTQACSSTNQANPASKNWQPPSSTMQDPSTEQCSWYSAPLSLPSHHQRTTPWKSQTTPWLCCNPSRCHTDTQGQNMVLAIHSNASHLTKSTPYRQAGGHFYMSNNSPSPLDSGSVLNIANILKSVMSSADEAELRSLFINSKQATPAHTIIEEMEHNQPPTPV